MDIPCLVAIFIFIYDSHEARVSQCKALRICGTCTRCGHVAGEYFGRELKLSFECEVCKSKSHISALCPDFIGRGPALPLVMSFATFFSL